METDEVKDDNSPTVRPLTESEGPTSAVFHVSVRAWLALILCGTVCWMSIMGQSVAEPLYTLAIAAAIRSGTKASELDDITSPADRRKLTNRPWSAP